MKTKYDGELRWVMDGKVGLPPTPSDAMEYADDKLNDRLELECTVSDRRIPRMKNLIRLFHNLPISTEGNK